MESVRKKWYCISVLLVLVVLFLPATGCEKDDGGPAITSPHNFLNATDATIELFFADTLLPYGEDVRMFSESVVVPANEQVELGVYLSPPPGFIGVATSRFPSDYLYAFIVRPGIDTTAYAQSKRFSECTEENNPLCANNYLLVDERIGSDEEVRIFTLTYQP